MMDSGVDCGDGGGGRTAAAEVVVRISGGQNVGSGADCGWPSIFHYGRLPKSAF